MSIDFKLYLITDRKLFEGGRAMLSAVEDALQAGVKAVQLREKDLTAREILSIAHEMRELTAKYNARLFINDRVDIALCVNADGVHLRQNSIPVDGVKKAVQESRIMYNASRFLIGVSTHTIDEALNAEKDDADFITFGPVYETPSKMKYGKPVGLEALKETVKKVSIPIFAIGGIKVENIDVVVKTGASGVALISGILGSSNIKNAVKNYLKVLGEKS